jgi:hypothetical protein
VLIALIWAHSGHLDELALQVCEHGGLSLLELRYLESQLLRFQLLVALLRHQHSQILSILLALSRGLRQSVEEVVAVIDDGLEFCTDPFRGQVVLIEVSVLAFEKRR